MLSPIFGGNSTAPASDWQDLVQPESDYLINCPGFVRFKENINLEVRKMGMHYGNPFLAEKKVISINPSTCEEPAKFQ